jgi:hypothetical protein
MAQFVRNPKTKKEADDQRLTIAGSYHIRPRQVPFQSAYRTHRGRAAGSTIRANMGLGRPCRKQADALIPIRQRGPKASRRPVDG